MTNQNGAECEVNAPAPLDRLRDLRDYLVTLPPELRNDATRKALAQLRIAIGDLAPPPVEAGPVDLAECAEWLAQAERTGAYSDMSHPALIAWAKAGYSSHFSAWVCGEIARRLRASTPYTPAAEDALTMLHTLKAMIIDRENDGIPLGHSAMVEWMDKLIAMLAPEGGSNAG